MLTHHNYGIKLLLHMINNYTIALDKLELMLKYPDTINSDNDYNIDFTLPDSTANKLFNLATIDTDNALETYSYQSINLFRNHDVKGHYKLQYDVEIHGVLLGFIRLLPTKPTQLFGGNPLIKLNIDNKLLYTNQLSTLINQFLDTLKLSINNITRYDIALDSNINTNDILVDLFTNVNLHFMNKGRSVNNILKVATLYRSGQENASFYVGDRKATQVAFYNKTKQSSALGYAKHIKTFHQANDLDTNKNIYRVEVRVPHKSLKQWKSVYQNYVDKTIISVDKWKQLTTTEKSIYAKQSVTTTREVTIADLTNSATLLTLFKLDFEAIVDFRKKDKANKDRCTKIQIFNFNQTADYKLTKSIYPSMHVDTNMIKKQIKNNLENYKYSKKMLFWDEARELAYSNNLVDYLAEIQAKLKVSTPISTTLASNKVSLF